MFLTEIFFPEPYNLWTWKSVTTCDVAVPTTANGRVVPTATTEDVRPRELGRYRRVMSSGDKQGQNANGDWQNDLK